MSEHLTGPARRTRLELLDVVDRLIAEFPDEPAGVVIAQVVRARERHHPPHARGDPDAVTAVECAARERILRATPVDNVPDAIAARDGAGDGRRWFAIDPRPYRQRTGNLLITRRVTVAGAWTPFVAVRVRRLRAADGGTEL